METPDATRATVPTIAETLAKVGADDRGRSVNGLHCR